jgi:hypothetical protein
MHCYALIMIMEVGPETKNTLIVNTIKLNLPYLQGTTTNK